MTQKQNLSFRRSSAARKRRSFSMPFKILFLTVVLISGWTLFRLLRPGENGAISEFRKEFIAAGIGNEKSDADYRIVIDPGHGGDDDGAVGYCVEKDVTAGTTEALRLLLEADSRFDVLLTKGYDETASVDERKSAAEAADADLFLSIHCNSDADASSSGFECYASPPGWDGHEESLLLAQQIAAAVADSISLRLRGSTGVRYMYFTANGGRQVAEEDDERAYGYETFGLLHKASCPSVLIEQFFVTNPQESADYACASGYAALARCYYEGICSYFDLRAQAG